MPRPASAPPFPWRTFAATFVSTAYVVILALRVTGARGGRPWAFGIIALILATVAVRRVRRTSFVAMWGLALVTASLGQPAPNALLAACACAGALMAACAAGYALARVVAPPSLVSSRLPSAAPVVLSIAAAWLVAGYSQAAGAVRAWSWVSRHPSICTGGAALLTVIVLSLAALRVLYERRLELGITARAGATLGLLATGTVLVLGAGLLRFEDLIQLACFGIALASLCIIWFSLHPDGIAVARLSRRVLFLAFVGGTVTLIGAGAAEGTMREAGLATLVTAVIALSIGSAARPLEAPLRPVQGEWLDAIAAAREALFESDPEEAVRKLLVYLRDPAGPHAPSPELWTLAPTRVATVDQAGYLRERNGELPESVFSVAGAEPEATLRIEVLESLEVRRPDLRPLARWLRQKDGLLATVVTRGGEPEGLLMLPAGKRTEVLAQEEASAIKALADALAAVCHARSQSTRSMERERELRLEVERSEQVADGLRHQHSLEVGRHALATARLARAATVGIYSAASRMAFDGIERRVSVSAPVALVAPSGVDPIPFLARAHLGGPRANAPFVVVDGTAAREHDLARWNDRASSPLALVDGGMLVLVDGASLPLEVQRLLGRALAEKRPPWEQATPLDVSLAFTGVTSPEALQRSGRLDPTLAMRLGEAVSAPLVLPRLRDRAEDLRAIVTDRLAREGLRVRGTPLGIDSAAYGRLVEYEFPGEDAELSTIVQQLVASAKGDVVQAADVDALGLGKLERKDRVPADPLSA